MKERIQKILSERGVTSRRAAEKLISDGLVTVNGRTATLGESADADTDEICVRGERIDEPPERVYIMLNKPRGYVTTLSDERGRKTVAELVSDCGARVYPVGRLDLDSDGLLIMTNDGELANHLMHPKNEVRKTYIATVGGDLNAAVPRLREPVTLDGVTVTAKSVTQINERQIEIIIGEGRNREVRKMCAAAGLRVTRLTRVSEGELTLGELKTGQWRHLTADEINLLQKGG
ncbi:MAG: rRNA pseudouridine synthase [Oscillospiraceae bacterium]|nr:rRNA pseudouridine synthase [Oscillospiraceae bacterium]